MNATAGTQTMKRVAEREGGGIGEQPVSGEGPPGVALAVQRRVGGSDEQGEENTDAYSRKRRSATRSRSIRGSRPRLSRCSSNTTHHSGGGRKRNTGNSAQEITVSRTRHATPRVTAHGTRLTHVTRGREPIVTVYVSVYTCAHTRHSTDSDRAHITTLRGERREVDQLPPRRPAAWTQLVPLFAGTVTRSNACGRDHHTLATERQGGALPGAGSATVATRALADAGSERWRRCRQLTPAGIRGRTKCRASAGGGCSRGACDPTADLTDGLR